MLFLSIHPKYVDAILSGRKTVELRKREPRVMIGSQLVIYASMPRCAAVATATISRIVKCPPSQLWPKVAKFASVTKDEFDSYFREQESAVGIHFENIQIFKNAITLAELRESWRSFHPPQQFRYLDATQQVCITERPICRTLS